MSENKTYQDEIVENYEQLREERGWSPATMGDHLEPLDPALAAEYRSRYVTEKARKSADPEKAAEESKAMPPKKRSAPRKSTAAKK